jgi:SAM-dependent methyltransferase
VSEPLGLTGERTLPGIPEENYWFRRHEAAYRFAAGEVAGRVLEVGCGEGYGAAALARGARVVAFEYDGPAAAHARERYGLAVARADACRLPVRDQVADAVVTLQVLEHLHCAAAFVEACARALREEGVLVASTPNRPTFSPGGTLNPFHVHEYDAGELAGLLGTAFGDVRLLGLRHRDELAERERAAGGSLPDQLMRSGYAGLNEAARRLVRRVRAEDFEIDGDDVEGSLDLVAVCRR